MRLPWFCILRRPRFFLHLYYIIYNGCKKITYFSRCRITKNALDKQKILKLNIVMNCLKMAKIVLWSLSLPWIREMAPLIYVSIAQICNKILVYLCKLTFLKKVWKKLKKWVDFFLQLRYNRQARKTRATSKRKLLIENWTTWNFEHWKVQRSR